LVRINIEANRGGTQHGFAAYYALHGALCVPAIPPAIEIAGFLAEVL
jgi:hypothetical protein